LLCIALAVSRAPSLGLNLFIDYIHTQENTYTHGAHTYFKVHTLYWTCCFSCSHELGLSIDSEVSLAPSLSSSSVIHTHTHTYIHTHTHHVFICLLRPQLVFPLWPNKTNKHINKNQTWFVRCSYLLDIVR
jgi:hypothetical protein